MSHPEQAKTGEERLGNFVRLAVGSLAVAVALHPFVQQAQEYLDENLSPQICITDSAMTPRGCD